MLYLSRCLVAHRRLFQSMIIVASAASLSHNAAALDLMEAYRQAQSNDTGWLSAKEKLKADQEYSNIGRAGLLPQMGVRMRSTANTYESTDPQTRLVEDDAQCQDDNPYDAFLCQLAETTGFGNISFISDEVADSYKETSISADLQQPILHIDKWHEYEAAKAKTAAGEAEFEDAAQKLMTKVSDAYFAVLGAREEYKLARNQENDYRRQLRLVKRRVEQGIAQDIDLYDMQAAYETSKQATVISQAALKSRYRSLATVTRVYDENIVPLSEDLPVETPVPEDAEAWVQLALAHNSLLEVGRKGLEASHQAYKSTRAKHLPTVSLIANYSQRDLKNGSGFIPAGDTSYIGIEVAVPIFSGLGVRAQRKQKFHEYEKARLELDEKRREISDMVRELHQTVSSNVISFQIAKDSVSANRNAYRATLAGYEDGTRDASQLIQARSKYSKAQSDLAKTRFEYVTNSLKLKRATGTLVETDLAAINKWLDLELLD